VTPDRVAELARVRAAFPLSDNDALIWFGVSLAVIERIEAGEIIPGDEVGARIDRYLAIRGGASPSAALPGRRSHCGGLTGEGVCDNGPLATFAEGTQPVNQGEMRDGA
jgi:hypothetical protein